MNEHASSDAASPAHAGGNSQVSAGEASLQLPTVEDALAFGRRLGAELQVGDLVLLDGPLGAGKTVITRGIAEGMNVTGPVTSPTFVIARVHRPAEQGESRPALVHVDAYRLTSLDELDDLDLDTDLTDAAVVVEWGEGFAERLAGDQGDYLVIRLRRLPDDTREARIAVHGQRWGRVAEMLNG